MLVNVIQCLSALGALAAAVAALRTVREMKAQREDALRVEFILAPRAAVATRSDEVGEFHSYEWLDRQAGDRYAGLQCANVGPSAAKAVRVRWLVDWSDVLTTLNQSLACDDDPSCGAELQVQQDRSISLRVGGVEYERWLNTPDIQCFPSVLPYASVSQYINVEVPYRLRRLCDLAYDAWVRDGLGSRRLLRATLQVEYEDLNSCSHTRTYEIAFLSYDLNEDTYMDVYGVLIGEPRVLDTYGLS